MLGIIKVQTGIPILCGMPVCINLFGSFCQSLYSKNNSPPISRVLCLYVVTVLSHIQALVIYLLRASPHGSSVLPSASDGQPSDGSLHELAVSRTHSYHVAMILVGSYPAFSPLPVSWRLFSSTLPNPCELLLY